MSTSVPFERAVTSRDLKHFWSDIVLDLRSGWMFVVYHDEQPLAHLHPVQRVLLPEQDTGSKLLLLYSPLIQLFGHGDLARMLGLTESGWRIQLSTGEFSVKVAERLEFLASLREGLSTFVPQGQLRRWFRRSYKELKGRSVVDHLSFPWNSGEVRAGLVQTLVEEERYEATPFRRNC